MLSLGSPVTKRSRLSLKKSKLPLFSSIVRETDICTNLSVGESHFPDAKTNTVFTTEIDNLVIKNESCVQDENASPNVPLTVSELRPSQSLTNLLVQPQIDDIETSVLGLPNCGNTCYLNSVLQVLRYTPNFLFSLHRLLSVYVHQKKLSPNEVQDDSELLFFERLHILYIAMKKQEDLLVTNTRMLFNYDQLLEPVESFIISLREVSSKFKEDEQHDAHELLLAIISFFSLTFEKLKGNVSSSPTNTESETSMHFQVSELEVEVSEGHRQKRKRKRGRPRIKPHINKNDKKTNIALSSLIKEQNVSNDESFLDDQNLDSLNLIFEGKLCHIIKCLECEVKLEREEFFSDLQVSIAPDDSSECAHVLLMDCLSQSTFLTGDNKYYCENCFRRNEAKLSSEIVTSPSVLLLHLSWLSKFSELTEVEQEHTRVMIPLSLQTSKDYEIFSRIPEQNYKLYAVILHIGNSALGGHYVSFVKLSALESLEVKSSIATTVPMVDQTEVQQCCMTEEVTCTETVESTENNSWLLFDDEKVSPVCVKSVDTFPYFNYLGSTATPCMIFYRR